jgi:RsiW-degrading membrane proteinase PrsW (M82 family)
MSTGAPLQGWPAPSNPTPRPALRRVLGYGALLTVFLLCLALLALFLGVDVGLRAAALAAVFAAIPMFVVVPVFLWLDRFEAEPTRLLVATFLWGAVCAPVGALVFNTGIHRLFVLAGARDAEAMSAVLSAPPVEEGLKGLAILLVLLLRRREFDGVVDGIVYAGMVGAGFAFSENIVYLGRAFDENGLQGLTGVFILRCLVGPFAHPLFTACTGIGLGLAASVARTSAARFAFAVLGYAVAILLHAIWNLSAVMGAYVKVYLLFQVPVFLGFLVLVVLLRRRESRLIRLYLSQYADAGWLTHPEVAMLASLPARRQARSWAAANGGKAAASSMQALQDTAADLALLRARIVNRSAEAEAGDRERELLQSLTTHRAAFVGTGAL